MHEVAAITMVVVTTHRAMEEPTSADLAVLTAADTMSVRTAVTAGTNERPFAPRRLTESGDAAVKSWASATPASAAARGDIVLSGSPAIRSGQPLRSAAISSMTAVRSSMATARLTGWPVGPAT